MTDPKITLCETGLKLILQPAGNPSETAEIYLNYMWLRDNCPRSWDAQTQDRVFDLTATPAEIRPADARIDGDRLVIDWQGEAHTSRYALDWLVQWARAPGHPDPARVPVHPWRADASQKVAHFAFDRIKSDWAARTAYMRTMLESGLAVVEGVPSNEDGVTETAEFSGIVRANFSGQYFNVRYFPEPTGAAFTAGALEPHTDNPCEEFQPGIQYLHCIRNESTGGESTFADGAAVAADLKRDHPDDFAVLSTVSVPFRYTHDAMDLRARHKVILTDPDGDVTGVTVSQHMSDIFDLGQETLDRFYPAFRRFLQMLRSDKYEIEFALKSGECVVFDNQRIVHGRRAFDPMSGIRILRGCYTDRGELRSRYRVLQRDGYIRDFSQQGAA